MRKSKPQDLEAVFPLWQKLASATKTQDMVIQCPRCGTVLYSSKKGILKKKHTEEDCAEALLRRMGASV